MPLPSPAAPSVPSRHRLLSLLAWLCLTAPVASAQTYPNKPLRMLTAETGGGSDVTARILAQGLNAALGQQVVVDNRVGGVNIASIAAAAAPDGYTLFTYSNTLWLIPLMREHTPYDAMRDFTPISLLGGSPMILVVHPAVAAHTPRELIALARAQPGTLNFATGPSGAIPHLAGELFKALADVRITQVPYRGVGAAVTDVIGGRVQIMFPNASAALPHIRSGRLRGLAVTSAQPSSLTPGIATLAESGLPGYACTALYATFAPARTPQTLVTRLNREITAYLKQPEAGERFKAASAEVIAGTPEGLHTVMADEIARFGKVLKAANIKLD